MKRATLFGFVLVLAGCAGPKAGDVLTIIPGTEKDGARIYFDEAIYRSAAEGKLDPDGAVKAYAERRCELLAPGSRLRVVTFDPEHGGLFVAVEHATTRDALDFSRIRGAPELVGRDGWVLRKDLEPLR